MKKKKHLSFKMFLSIAFIMIAVGFIDASVNKWIRVGRIWDPIIDSGNQSMNSPVKLQYYDDGFLDNNVDRRGFSVIMRDWRDEFGENIPFMVAGHAHEGMDETRNTVPVADDEGITIRKYVRTPPPTIVVDGAVISDPFPLTGDAVDPDRIPGTADILIESTFRIKVGIEVTQRVYAWSTKDHDDYHVYDWTFTNTGNIDRDDDIELPDQVLHDVYFSRTWSWEPDFMWEPWHSYYGQYPGDTLRMVYGYPDNDFVGEAENYYGNPDLSTGFLNEAMAVGETWIHTDRSVDDPTNDPIGQPHQYGYESVDFIPWALSSEDTGPGDWATYYQVVTEGFGPWNGTPLDDGTHPGTFFNEPYDRQGDGSVYVPTDYGYLYYAVPNVAFGPYEMQFGDSFRIVWATLASSLSPQQRWGVGKAWLDGTCDELWEGEYKLPPWIESMYSDYPDYDTENNRAKDSFVFSAVDSLFMNANAAKWAADHNFEVPIPPPPPSVTVNGMPDQVKIIWGNESEAVADFAGYRVYRAQGGQFYDESDGVIVGDWQMIFECGAGTDNALTNSFDDVTAERAQAYFYHVAAFDDGTHPEVPAANRGGVKGIAESLESGRYLNMTTKPVFLSKPAATSLDAARVVPNPYNIKFPAQQFIGEPNKIMFMDLPPICTIKIFSESGDLIRTLYHTDGSGDEPWGFALEQHSASETGQIIVSGVYIAHIETPDGASKNLKFFVVR